MRCRKALRAATTPHQAVDRSWADVQVIGKLLHCENTLRRGGEHLNDGLPAGLSTFKWNIPEAIKVY
jgi:hypothetical protein